MNRVSIRASLFFALACVSLAASAVQLSATDVSNHVITCSGPLLAGKPAGSCLVEPPNTIIVTATLEPGDSADAINKMHVVLLHQGTFHQYVNDPNIPATKRWAPRSPDLTTTLPASTATFQIAPFESTSISRQVSFDQFAKLPGAQLFIGVSNAKTPAPSAREMKKVFDVK